MAEFILSLIKLCPGLSTSDIEEIAGSVGISKHQSYGCIGYLRSKNAISIKSRFYNDKMNRIEHTFC